MNTSEGNSFDLEQHCSHQSSEPLTHGSREIYTRTHTHTHRGGAVDDVTLFLGSRSWGQV